MRRRTALATLATGVAALAGCGDTPSSTATPTASPTSTASTADLSVLGVDAPETVEAGQSYEFSVRVRNPTSRPGLFRSGISLRIDGSWQSLDGEVGGRVPAGETRSLSASLPGITFLDEYGLRLDGVDRTWSFEVVPQTLAFGDTLRTPQNLRVTVAGTTVQRTFVSGNRTVTPASGSRWVVADVRVTSSSEETVRFPPFSAFALLLDGEEHAVALSDPGAQHQIAGDLSRFELPFHVPAGATESDMAVRWTPTYQQGTTGAVWSGSAESTDQSRTTGASPTNSSPVTDA